VGNITLRELWDRKWSLLAYCLGSLGMLLLYIATFRSTQASSQQLQALVKAYPKGFLDAFGLNNLAPTTIEQYLDAKHFSFIWPLLAIILALSRAAAEFAGEIQTGTMGLVLSLPLRRLQIFMAKYAAGLITILVFTTVSVFGIIPAATAYNIPSHLHILVPAWILTSLFMWSIYAVGLLVSVWVSDKTKVYGIAGGVIMLSYIMNLMALLSSRLNTFKHYSLFYYFDTQDVLTKGHIPTHSLVVFAAVIIIATGLAAWHFNQRDISV